MKGLFFVALIILIRLPIYIWLRGCFSQEIVVAINLLIQEINTKPKSIVPFFTRKVISRGFIDGNVVELVYAPSEIGKSSNVILSTDSSVKGKKFTLAGEKISDKLILNGNNLVYKIGVTELVKIKTKEDANACMQSFLSEIDYLQKNYITN